MSASQQKRNKELHAQIESLETRLSGMREELKVAREDALEEAAKIADQFAQASSGSKSICGYVADSIRTLSKGAK